MAVIEIEGLHKEYYRLRGGKTIALKGLDLEVPEGGVFGFLGPNGSGKTTTIRCLLGLTAQGRGRCRVLGQDSPAGLPAVISKIGSIVETPAFFNGMSGRRNLRLLAGVYGISDEIVDENLATVGLFDRADDLVKNYSLGMKQRLGIAAALLKDPTLLVLDEPANGLDPAGIKEIRELLRRLGGEGRTVFVSSHILSEVQQTCDRVAIISRGRCVTAGPVNEVLQQGKATGLIARLDDLDAGLAALGAAGITAVRADDSLRIDLVPEQAATVTRVLAERGLYLSELRKDELDLETVFLELTRDPAPEEGS
ncbi:MAG: ABC transporter ATP-binding protein [Actinomycetota bacterium]